MTIPRTSVVIAAGAGLLLLSSCDAFDEKPTAEIDASGQLSKGEHGHSERIGICHKTGRKGFSRLEIAGAALESHLQHGDAFPGDAAGYDGPLELVFDGHCEKVLYCPCWTAEEVSGTRGLAKWLVDRVNELPGWAGPTQMTLASESLTTAFSIDYNDYPNPNSCSFVKEGASVREVAPSCLQAWACTAILTRRAHELGIPCTDVNDSGACEPALLFCGSIITTSPGSRSTVITYTENRGSPVLGDR